jgi:hypothetical protein
VSCWLLNSTHIRPRQQSFTKSPPPPQTPPLANANVPLNFPNSLLFLSLDILDLFGYKINASDASLGHERQEKEWKGGGFPGCALPLICFPPFFSLSSFCLLPHNNNFDHSDGGTPHEKSSERGQETGQTDSDEVREDDSDRDGPVLQERQPQQ